MSFKLLSFLILFVFFFSSSVAPVLAAITYTYDANGNMTSDGTKCFQYNEANQMDKVTNCANGQTIAEYVYDHSGIRLVKKEFENGVLKRTIYSPADEYETVKMASNGATANTTYYKANDEVAAKKNPDGTKTYYQNDHLGSTAVLSNQAGAQVEKTVYAPYGEVKSGGTVSKFGYTGQEKDLESGLNYYGARYYDAHVQRFIQPDTIVQNSYNPQSLNRYSYAWNNPIKYIDPSGHLNQTNLYSPTLGRVTSFGTKADQQKLQASLSPSSNNYSSKYLSNFSIPVNNSTLKQGVSNNSNQTALHNLAYDGKVFAKSSPNIRSFMSSLPIPNNSSFLLTSSATNRGQGLITGYYFDKYGYAPVKGVKGGSSGSDISLTYSPKGITPNTDEQSVDASGFFMNFTPSELSFADLFNPTASLMHLNGFTTSRKPGVSTSNIRVGGLSSYSEGSYEVFYLK